MIRLTACLFALAAAACPAAAQDIAPSGTLRAVFLAQNPVQGTIDPATGEVRGPAADITRELAKRAGKPASIKGVDGTAAVMAAVKAGEADIGFLAYDPARAAVVDFSQTYSLAQNTYFVLATSPLHRGSDIDKPGVKVGVGERDAGDLFLTRTLKQATLIRNSGGDLDVALRHLQAGEINAYAANRQRISKFLEGRTDLRMFPDNFYGVEQGIVVAKGNAATLSLIDQTIADMRKSGALDESIRRSGLTGVDVAPPPTGPRQP